MFRASRGYRAKLAAVTVLICGGLLAASTAATVVVSGEPQRWLAARRGTGGSPLTLLGLERARNGDAITALIDSLIALQGLPLGTDPATWLVRPSFRRW